MDGVTLNSDRLAASSPRDPHSDRRKAILATHPELRSLMRRHPQTALWILAVLVFQLLVAGAVGQFSWWIWLIAAYVVGAPAALALWTLLHECSHDLVFRIRRHNRWMGIVAGLALVLPVATSFRKYHLLHHRHHGDPQYDADIASQWEMRIVGNRTLRKGIWLFFGPIVQSLRAARMKRVGLWDRDLFINMLIQCLFCAAIIAMLGWGALTYLLLSNCFSLGLHPLGGRTIQEHFMLAEGQETYSYYGRGNSVVFNAGFHVEHHDLVGVPWINLPQVRQIAPEFYSGLNCYNSWSALLWRFLRDRSIGLDRRTIRGDGTIR